MGSPVVVSTAQLMCTMGVMPAVLSVLPAAMVTAGGSPVACIMDDQAMVNIATFGMCTSPLNPQVAAATAAALGVLTPQPCIPMIPAPWTPGNPMVLVGGKPIVNVTSMCMCAYAGEITVVSPGEETVLA